MKYALFIFALLASSCRPANHCFDSDSDQSHVTIQFVEELADCRYRLSDFLQTSLWGHDVPIFRLSGGRAYIITDHQSQREELLFFSLNDQVGTLRAVKLLNGDWANGQGDDIQMRTYEIQVMNNLMCDDERIIHLRLSSFYRYEDSMYDFHFYFTDQSGFVTSFYTSPNHPNEYCDFEGPKYANCIEYTDVDFCKLM